MTFGEEIRELRKQVGLSQRDLAERIGIHFTYLSKIENGRADPPSEDVIRKLAEELNSDPHHLIVLAGKMPSDFARALADNPEALQYLRRLTQGRVTKRRGPHKHGTRPTNGWPASS